MQTSLDASLYLGILSLVDDASCTFVVPNKGDMNDSDRRICRSCELIMVPCRLRAVMVRRAEFFFFLIMTGGKEGGTITIDDEDSRDIIVIADSDDDDQAQSEEHARKRRKLSMPRLPHDGAAESEMPLKAEHTAMVEEHAIVTDDDEALARKIQQEEYQTHFVASGRAQVRREKEPTPHQIFRADGLGFWLLHTAGLEVREAYEC